jgi:hypothetical protein
MKLFDLDKKNVQTKALKENFNITFNPSKLDKIKTVEMLKKVRGLIKEAKQSPSFYRDQNNGSYMKLVFMEQSLTKHFTQLQKQKVRIVTENVEVEKSQVILAAQDMVDSIQKMIEEVNDMLVKELPALVDSIQSEIGVNESSQFNSQASESLTTLNQTLNTTKTALQSALNGMTGQGDSDAFDVSGTDGEEMAVTDIGATSPGGEEMVGAEEVTTDVSPEPIEEPEIEPVGGVGRAKR